MTNDEGGSRGWRDLLSRGPRGEQAAEEGEGPHGGEGIGFAGALADFGAPRFGVVEGLRLREVGLTSIGELRGSVDERLRGRLHFEEPRLIGRTSNERLARAALMQGELVQRGAGGKVDALARSKLPARSPSS